MRGLLLGVDEDQRVMALYSFIAEEKADADSPWSVAEMCRWLGVSRSGFYDWEARGPSPRELSDAQLATEIEAIFVASGETYGSPRVHRWLRRQGFRVGRKRVARIMCQRGWVGQVGRSKVRTTVADKTAAPSADLVARDFNPAAPDRTWAGDITYVATGEGWLYLATVIDLYSRRVIGWSITDHLRTELVADALTMAIATRGGVVEGVIFHSDRGCLGGLNRSSQRLDRGGVPWGLCGSGSGRCSCIGGRCRRRVGRRWRGGRTGWSSGRQSREVRRRRTPHWGSVCHPRLGHGGSVTLAA
jgi:hypothetical protein